MMIRVKCITYLDDYQREEWPDEFCCRPIVGDKVVSKSGKMLTVCAVAHQMYQDRSIVAVELTNS
jgi:hypothetical protein